MRATLGYDLRGGGPFGLRVGLRWRGRPQVGTGYVGPVNGLALQL